ncbi:MAG: nitrous oxide reductase family maturation protein NosD, partial [Thermomicrobiales bacterium]|nr:nitrous oxide reductase family maturation protein NosD [Thermomicrobiales bacterium]
MFPANGLSHAWRLAGLVLACALMLGPAVAQGSEASTVAVCPTCDVTSLAEALAIAPSGATIEVRGGTYPGDLVIDRPVHLVASEGAVIDGGGKGSLVTIRDADASLSGFTLRGTGDNLDREDAAIVVEGGAAVLIDNRIEDALFGIYLKNAPGSVLRDNVILGKDVPTARKGDGIKAWYSDGVVIENNRASDGRDIILWYSRDGVVRNNTFDGGRYGLHLMYSDNTQVAGNSLSANSIGLYIMYSRDPHVVGNRIVNNHGPSGGGVGLKDVDGAVIEGNRFVNNQIAIQVDESPREPGIENYIRGNVFAFNEAGIGFLPAVRHNTVTGNAFIDNTEQVAIIGRGQLRDITWAEQGRGNYWSDYAGYDADGDGVGDLPYRSQRLFESLVDGNPLLRLFTWTPAASAIDFAARAMPGVRPEVKLSDPAPLMSPVAHQALPPLAPAAPGARAELAAAGLALSGLAAAVYLGLRRPRRAL